MSDAGLPKREHRRIVVACIIANFLKYLDFALYGFFAVAIGAVFFPSHDLTMQLLLSLTVFGVVFFFRPLGGVVFGLVGDRVGDRLGRRTAPSISIAMMEVATTVPSVRCPATPRSGRLHECCSC